MDQNYFEVLEIPSDADEREIKRAYYRFARELHPDKASSPEEAQEFEAKFARVSAAYNNLKDPTRREEYRQQVSKKPAQAQTASSGAARNASASGAAASGGRGTHGITPERIAIAQKAFTRGMQFFKDGNMTKAIDFFDAAIKNNETDPLFHARLALALIQDRRSASRALEHAQHAIELDTYNLDYKFNLGYIYETIGSTSNARKVYEDILRWDGENVRAREALQGLDKKKKRTLFGIGAQSSKNGKGPRTGLLGNLLSRFQR